jgi:late competence protein required for DNA uptake (superfamily II DNA/RNA helicase)
MLMKIKLNDDQASALAQILAAYHAGETRHALTGNAGTGKTTLMQAVVAKFLEKGVSICVTAPTHKAVSVLAKKLRDAGLSSIKAMTIHSLLGLTRVLQFALATRWNHSKIWPYACSVVLKSFRLVARSRLKILNLSMNGQSCCGPRL